MLRKGAFDLKWHTHGKVEVVSLGQEKEGSR